MRSARHAVALTLAIVGLMAPSGLAQEERGGADNEVTSLLGRLLVHAPEHFRGLTVFPLELRGAGDDMDYTTLDDALRQGFLRIFDTGTVERVTMENTSRHHWVFLLAGEVIGGGKQNRMVRDDVLIAPDTRVSVPTYCVEKGRWVGGDHSKFDSGKYLGNYALRQRAMAGAPQAEVWDQVEGEQRRFRVESATKDYEAVAGSRAVAGELAAYRGHFDRIWRPRIVGFVVAQGGQIVGADAFCNPRLFNSLRHKLLDSYAFDCVGRFERIRPPVFRQEDARDFMARIYSARFRNQGTPGAGSSLGFSGHGVEGAALLNRNAVLHLHATPGYRILPPPVPLPPGPLPIPQPRER
ncbi:MAG: hypothetical protein FJ291_28440 [Planctomycetes bacterium]|nr:hypothetical protein [Planctomycetota bacterium]